MQFIADQFVHTSASFALFLGLTARMIWLRKHRRRRGARERRGSRPHPAQLIPFRLISIRRNSAPSSSIQSDARSLAPPPHPASRPDGRRVHRVGVPGRGPRGAHPKGGARARLPAAAVPARRLVAGETDCFPYGPRSRVARRFLRTSGLLSRDASLTLLHVGSWTANENVASLTRVPPPRPVASRRSPPARSRRTAPSLTSLGT